MMKPSMITDPRGSVYSKKIPMMRKRMKKVKKRKRRQKTKTNPNPRRRREMIER